MTHQMDMPMTCLTERHQASVWVLPRLATIDIPPMMNVQLTLRTTATATETITAHNLLTTQVPAVILQQLSVSPTS